MNSSSRYLIRASEFCFKLAINALNPSFLSIKTFSSIPKSILIPQKFTFLAQTPSHHKAGDLLSKELCAFPDYSQIKLRRPGFQNAIQIRDYKRRQVAAHFAPLRMCLNAIRKNKVLPKEIQDKSSLQLHSLPRDSCATRILQRCTMTARRRGCKVRWRISRIVFRNFADYNRMSGVTWAWWSANTQSERRHLPWPPSKHQGGPSDMILKYYLNDKDEEIFKSLV